MTLNASEEVREPLRTVIDAERLEQLPVGHAYHHAMTMATHIDAHPKFWTQDHGTPIYRTARYEPLGSSAGLDYRQSHSPKGRLVKNAAPTRARDTLARRGARRPILQLP